MADKDITSQPAAVAVESTQASPQPERNDVSSPAQGVSDETREDLNIEAADDDNDSTLGLNNNSETTSITSSFYAGYVQNGRRYQTLRDGEYWGPSDEKQFESMRGLHIVHYIMDQKAKNPLFYSPISDTPQNILDIGTGTGVWAMDVADRYPSAVVYGIDLYPPPETWVPPNCKLEVDDALKEWTYKQKFDLIHMRDMYGSFTDKQWRGVYKQAYNNLLPGGWIEQIEPAIDMRSDDGTLPEGSALAGWGPMFIKCCAKSERDLDTIDRFKARIENAGFINVHVKEYKVPVGDWAKNSHLKEAGRLLKQQLLAGLEGYAMMILTTFGEPQPWTAEEVQVYLAKIRNEANNGGCHFYQQMRRVWAQKPVDAGPATEKSEVEL